MRGATLEVRLEELGVFRSFSRPRVSNDNPYSETLFRTVKYRPDYSSTAIGICKKRSDTYKQARIANPNRWSRLIRFWRQLEVVCIYPPAGDFIAQTPKMALAARWAAESLFLLRVTAGDV